MSIRTIVYSSVYMRLQKMMSERVQSNISLHMIGMVVSFEAAAVTSICRVEDYLIRRSRNSLWPDTIVW